MAIHNEEHCNYNGPGCGHKDCPHSGDSCPHCMCRHVGICPDCGCDVDHPDRGCDCFCHYSGLSDDSLRKTERRQMGIIS